MAHIECKCVIGYFTCRHCLQNAKPYFFTLSDGSRVYDIPVQHAPIADEILDADARATV